MVMIYADGADFETIFSLNNNDLIHGFTTNPTLMRQAGIKDYEIFSKKVLAKVINKPISFRETLIKTILKKLIGKDIIKKLS